MSWRLQREKGSGRAARRGRKLLPASLRHRRRRHPTGGRRAPRCPPRPQQHVAHVAGGQWERGRGPAAANGSQGKNAGCGRRLEKGGREHGRVCGFAARGGLQVPACLAPRGGGEARWELQSCAAQGRAGPGRAASLGAGRPLAAAEAGGAGGAPMAAAAERTDELVREYLLFRGFTAALKQLDAEIKADREKGFRVRQRRGRGAPGGGLK